MPNPSRPRRNAAFITLLERQGLSAAGVGSANVWYACAFTQGSLPWNLQTRLSWKSAKELLMHSFERRQQWKVFLRLPAAHRSSPCVHAGG